MDTQFFLSMDPPTVTYQEKRAGVRNGKYDFTLFNIQKIAAQMNAEMGKGVQDTIVELFDKMTENTGISDD